MQALDVIRVTRACHPVAVVNGRVTGMGTGERVVHRVVALQQTHTPTGLQAAHGRGEGAAGKPVPGGKGMAVLITWIILDDGRCAERASHRHAEAHMGIAPDEAPHGLGVSRGGPR